MSFLIFSKTTGYRHDCIPNAVAALSALANEMSTGSIATEDSRHFSTESLARFRAVVWLCTSGDVLEPSERQAFEVFVRGGGGYVGIHSASASEGSSPFYGEIAGARFTGHPEPCTARLVVEDREHPATRHLPASWLRRDEWYEFDHNPRAHARVLISVDEGSYAGGQMGDHPLCWCHPLGAGRCFYSALGHFAEDYADPPFLEHLRGALSWASGMSPL